LIHPILAAPGSACN